MKYILEHPVQEIIGSGEFLTAVLPGFRDGPKGDRQKKTPPNENGSGDQLIN